MAVLGKIKPSLWDMEDTTPATSGHRLNYRRLWKLVVLLTGGVSLIPLIFITVVNYVAMQNAIESEFLLRTARIVSNTSRVISFFLAERKSALDFIVHDNSFQTLENNERLSDILENLRESFGGGFVDLGIIDSSGSQTNYVGPYELVGKDYSGQEWFQKVIDQGVDISDVFLGYRKIPHLVIAVKGFTQEGSFYILRASLNIAPFENHLSNLELAGMGDAFMINHQGILQTRSRYHGGVLDRLPLPVPEYSGKTEVLDNIKHGGQKLLIGYRYIDDSPFVLMVVKRKQELMKPWFRTRLKLVIFLLFSVTIILTVVFWTASYMVKKIKLADEKRVYTLHQVEYSNKMASIGRLAASIAHEINNPLAIINEKAGLIKDLFLIKKQYAKDDVLLRNLESVLNSVKRAGRITKRLLTFARNLQASVETIRLRDVIMEVIGFMEKEAELRGIEIKVDVPDTIPDFESDRGKLQQIFLNIFNNAFAAVSDGGHLSIIAQRENSDFISVSFNDDGCGIAREDIDRVFEPFFSTKTGQGGTGLGLSITYNLVQEIGGRITVQSELAKGTSFKIFLPLVTGKKENEKDEGTARR